MSYAPEVEAAIKAGLITVRPPDPHGKRNQYRQARRIALDELERRFERRIETFRRTATPLALEHLQWCLGQVRALNNYKRTDND